MVTGLHAGGTCQPRPTELSGFRAPATQNGIQTQSDFILRQFSFGCEARGRECGEGEKRVRARERKRVRKDERVRVDSE